MISDTIITNFENAVNYGFNVVAVSKDKKPIAVWKQFQHRVQTEQEREEQLNLLRQRKASTIALINGIAHLVAIDVDASDKTKPVPTQVLFDLLQKLGLPETYEWAWRSVSSSGWHIWITVPDLPESEKLRVVPSDKLRETGWNNVDYIRAIEIRARTLYTLIPPSVELPNSPPSPLAWKTISTVFALKEQHASEYKDSAKKRVTPHDRAYARAALQSAAKNIAAAREGNRNNTLFSESKSVGRFVEAGALDEEEFIETIAAASPLSERETMSTIKSALKHAKEQGPRYAPAQQPQQKGKNKATLLVELAKENAEFFHDDQHNAYARVAVNGHKEVKPLRAKDFKLWLFKLLHEQNINPPGSEVYTSAINTLESIALYDSPREQVYLRVAPDGDSGVYIDLCNDNWQAVYVTQRGWQLVSSPSVNFVRKRGMLSLPEPVAGGSIEDFRLFGNIPDNFAWSLVKAWLTASLFPEGPYPVLVLKGEQGCAKTTLAKMLRSLIDPANPELRRPPREPEDLYIAASSCWVLGLDNISYISDWLSDDLCSLATGGGHARRQLYTDDEEVLFSAQRPVILNGITDFIHRDDLLDRTVIVELQRIPEHMRRDEKTLWAEFEAYRPKLFGALLDRLVGALRERQNVKLSVLPRMADFALVAAAAEKYEVSTGWSEETSTFLQSYRAVREEAHEHAIEASVVGGVLMAWLESVQLPWEGAVSELLERLTEKTNERQLKAQGWPKTVSSLGSTLRRIAPALRAVGYNIEFLRTKNSRLIRITKTQNDPETPSPSSPNNPPPNDGGNGSGEPARIEPGATQEETMNTHMLENAENVATALNDIMAQPVVGLDIETTGLSPFEHQIRLVQIATPNRVYMLDAFRTDVRLLKPLFDAEKGPILTGHNLKFDLAFLRRSGIDAPKGERLFDTILAAKLLSAGEENPRHGLDAVVYRYLNETMSKALQLSNWSVELTQAQLEYAARDAYILLPLRDALLRELDAAKLTDVAMLENRALPSIVWMEDHGVLIDQTAWKKHADTIAAEVLDIEKELLNAAGKSINWRSTQQVLKLLRERGHEIKDTNDDTLKPLAAADNVIKLLLQHREASKKYSAFGHAFLEFVRSDSRIHPDFDQIGAVSGRMTCRKPNLQQIPRKDVYRSCFIAPEGRVLVKADYSQIELRIAADITRDIRMLDAYQRHDDLHALTARLVLGKRELTKEDRQAAKALNFGLIYGMGAARLKNYAANSYGVLWTNEQAVTFRNKFFETYRGIYKWHRRQKQGSEETRTLAGRRRLNVEKFQEKLNTPVQGTGADGLKAALGLMWETRVLQPSAVPILAVHDEIVVECDEDDAETVKTWVVDCMQKGMEQFVKNVPVEVEAIVSRDWSGK